MASEYSFLPVFTDVPFDQNNNGDAILTGVSIPATIPAGNPSVPGFVDVVAFSVPADPGGMGHRDQRHSADGRG